MAKKAPAAKPPMDEKKPAKGSKKTVPLPSTMKKPRGKKGC
jgi:hypothetical protein